MDDGSQVDGHRYFEEMAVAHVLGGLDESEGRVFRSHLLECAHCRARVGELRAIAHDLADAERDERRVRAAQAIETKRRESEDEDDDSSIEIVRTRRASWIAIVVGLTLVLGLVGWNVALRGANRGIAQQNQLLLDASATLQLGSPAAIEYTAQGVDAVVRLREAKVAVLLDGLSPQAHYGVYLRDAATRVVWRRPFQSNADGVLLLTAERPGDALEIVVTRLADDARTLPDTPTGDIVLEARLEQP